MSKVPLEYREMLRNALKEEKANSGSVDRPLKRAKRGSKVLLTPVQRERELRKNGIRKEEHDRYIIHIDEDDENDEHKNKALKQNVNRNTSPSKEETASPHVDDESCLNPKQTKEKNNDSQTFLEESEEDEEFDSDEFEDVDLDGTSFRGDVDDDKEINITIKQHRDKKRKSERSAVVSREERVFRRTLHLLHLFIMVGHGVARNVWLSEPQLLLRLQKQIPLKLKNELQQYVQHRKKTTVTAQSKTRKLLDLLRHLMEYWQNIWTIDSRAPVLYKKTWNELKYSKTINHMNKQKMTKRKFTDALLSHVGSRDIAAQGFVALLRSINLPARLVFSVQPPDFTNMKKCHEEDAVDMGSHKTVKPSTTSKNKSQKKPDDNLLSILRSKKSYINKAIKTQAQKESEFSEKFGAWPVFWVEVWDKDSKKYITIDPIVKKTIEVINWKSKLEPPMNCVRNNAWYVVGYDRVGGIRDITRRYAKEYNAKVRKKRITREPKWEKWWEALLKGACSKKRLKDNRVDKFEEIEFEELALKEGMPSNVGDFKGHPLYVLEDDLKFNEILMPKISCGGLSNKAKSKKASEGFIPVYKRSNVHIVRSPRGWFMRGRVLKVGERPLKVREKNHVKKKGKRKTEDDFQLSDNDNDANDDEDDARLYAEFQTELYKPPPVVNGIIPKNAFKNIDIYEPWMIPAGCVHIRNPYAEKAAKMMSIEYAPAVVGFDFKGSRRDASAKIEGIVTFAEFKDAVELLCVGLKEMENEEAMMRRDLISLRAWKILLAKLKISKRLAHEHGEITEESENDDEDLESEDLEEFESGGFIAGNRELASSRTRSHYIGGNENENYEESLYSNVEAEEDSNLSASDFEDAANFNVDSHNFGITGIGEEDIYESRMKPMSRKRNLSNKETKSIFENDKSNSPFDAPGLLGTDAEMVYNPADGLNYNSSDDGESNSDNADAEDDRMNELDKEFADFENELGSEEDKYKKSQSESVAETMSNSKSRLNIQKDSEETDEEAEYSSQSLNDKNDEDYEFEYSD